MSNNTYNFPRLSYNNATSTLIVQCMPLPLHEAIIQVVNEAVCGWKASLPQDERSSVSSMSNQDECMRMGPWAGSEKAPHFGIRSWLNGEGALKWVLEVGFSQAYEGLRDTARLWLEGMAGEVDMVVLIKIQENPSYRCPLSPDEDPDARGIFLPIRPKDIACEGSLGPATYKGLTWVGHIDQVSMETWVRGEDGRAKPQGQVKDLLVEDKMDIPVENLFPPPQWRSHHC